MARALAKAGIDAVFSYAGRTAAPVEQPLPTRIGGFGGIDGLVAYLRAQSITHIIDATHPFAAQMSLNALAASRLADVPLIVLQRSAWRAGPEDNWQSVPDIAAAVSVLPETPSRVFLAIGKQNLTAFAAKPQHHYLLRLVDPPDEPVSLPDVSIVIARGPFGADEDKHLMSTHRITHLVAKNAGGSGAEAKLIAARALRLPVILIDRPTLAERQETDSVDKVMDWLDHAVTERGV